MIIGELHHLTKCYWNGRDARYFDCIHADWYKKDYPRFWDGELGKEKELVFAFFNFEAALNLNLTIKVKDIDVWALGKQSIGNRRKIIVGTNKIIEELLK